MTHDITCDRTVPGALRVVTIPIVLVAAGVVSLLATAPSTFRPTARAAPQPIEQRFEVGFGKAAWLVAAVTLVWIVLSTVASLTRRLVPTLRSCSWLDRATLPSVRRAIDRVFAIGVISGASLMSAAPARAATQPERTHQPSVVAELSASAHIDFTEVVPPYVRGPEPRPETPRPETPRAETPRAGPAAPDPQPPISPTRPTHVVARGDNLWSIARNELHARGATPTNQQVAVYWGELLRHNRHLRSGNPSLIFPGEVVRLAP